MGNPHSVWAKKVDERTDPASGRQYVRYGLYETGQDEPIDLSQANAIWVQAWNNISNPLWNLLPNLGDDPYLWFDKDLPYATYHVMVFMDSGTIYTATLTHKSD